MGSTQPTTPKQFKYVEDAVLLAAFQADLDAICLKHNVAVKPVLQNTDSSITCQIRLIQPVEVAPIPATTEDPAPVVALTAETVAESVEVLEAMEA